MVSSSWKPNEDRSPRRKAVKPHSVDAGEEVAKKGRRLNPETGDAPGPGREVRELQRVWQRLGDDDPLWAVLSQADKRGRRWKVDEFLATGQVQIDAQLAELNQLGVDPGRRLALDFGCGVGRLTRALAGSFERVLGVDVASSMLATARDLNADLGNVRFLHNASPRIESVAEQSVDFLYSHITLQHVPTELALGYVREFFRLLAPGGVCAFQFVEGADESLRGRVFNVVPNRWLNPLRRLAWRRREVFEMHVLPEARLRAELARWPGLRLLAERDDGGAGPGWHGRCWLVRNENPAPVRLVRDGHVLYVDPADQQIGAVHAAGVPYEAHIAAALREYLHAGAVMLDIGANIGSFALLAASLVGPAGRVIAVEPLQRNRVLLARAAQESGFDRIQVIAAAAADHIGQVELRTHPHTSNSACVAAAGELLSSVQGETVRVPTVVLDEVLGGLSRLDVIKANISGMEPLALRGLEATLRKFRPLLVSEFHPWAIERASGMAGEAYLHWLRRHYAAITVLQRDGQRVRCEEPGQVMQAWRRANAEAGMGERLHLDLLFEP